MSSGTKTKGYVAPGTEGSYIKDVTDVRPHHEEESSSFYFRIFHLLICF
eukprot:UN24794